MIKDINKYIDLLCKLKITPNQFLIAYLLEDKSDTNIQHIKKYSKAVEFDTRDVARLIELGYLEDFNATVGGVKYFNIDGLVITPKFSNQIFVNSSKAYEELAAVYPGFAIINGNKAILKGVDPDEVSETYLKNINKLQTEHEEVLKITEWAKKNNYLNIRIDKYVDNKLWLDFKELMKEDKGTTSGYGEKEF